MAHATSAKREMKFRALHCVLENDFSFLSAAILQTVQPWLQSDKIVCAKSRFASAAIA